MSLIVSWEELALSYKTQSNSSSKASPTPTRKSPNFKPKYQICKDSLTPKTDNPTSCFIPNRHWKSSILNLSNICNNCWPLRNKFKNCSKKADPPNKSFSLHKWKPNRFNRLYKTKQSLLRISNNKMSPFAHRPNNFISTDKSNTKPSITFKMNSISSTPEWFKWENKAKIESMKRILNWLFRFKSINRKKLSMSSSSINSSNRCRISTTISISWQKKIFLLSKPIMGSFTSGNPIFSVNYINWGH